MCLRDADNLLQMFRSRLLSPLIMSIAGPRTVRIDVGEAMCSALGDADGRSTWREPHSHIYWPSTEKFCETWRTLAVTIAEAGSLR